MKPTHEEIVEVMAETIMEITAANASRVKPQQHLDAEDDDYLFLDENLDRWGDRRVPKLA